MDLSLFCPVFLCQVLNQTWDLLGFFMFTSKTLSKTTTTFQEWNKLDGHLSLGLGHYPQFVGFISGMIIQKIQAFQQSCSLIWPLPAGFQRCTACSREDSWMPPQVGNSLIPNMAEMVYSYMVIYGIYPKNPGFCGISCTCSSKTMVFAAFSPFQLAGTAPEAGSWKAAFLAPSPHTWRNLMPFDIVKLKSCTPYQCTSFYIYLYPSFSIFPYIILSLSFS